MAGARAPKKPMTTTDASRIQSTQAKAGNDMSKGSFPAKAQAAAQTNLNKGIPGGGSAKIATGKPASGAGSKKK
ncbi:hypothetical protein V5O48_014822 [Marasmius crinis-equi]|uniref:SMP domain-containing protein n=1 Tax=Marasmius crinis-equi TaxID=585013 RepID=A0ABR3EW85_9AGAR